MRIPITLAWILLVGTFGTAALLRQFHDRTPEAPMVSPIVGSALFAAIFLLLLVAARERRKPARPGAGIRLAALLPVLLLLLIEKWVALTLHPLLYDWAAPRFYDPQYGDAVFRAMAGVGLLAVCVVVGWIASPTMRKTWRRARPLRWPIAAIGMVIVVVSSYLVLAGLNYLLGGDLRLHMPHVDSVFFWIVGGQGVLAFAEEFYYRGLLMGEVERLAPALGVRNAGARRWIALGTTSLLFGLEHLTIGPPWNQSLRELVFAIALGLLFGILVMVSTNLHFAAGAHAWINWLLLGAVPYFVDATGRPALPAGTYIGLTLILAFVLTYLFRLWQRRSPYREPLLES